LSPLPPGNIPFFIRDMRIAFLMEKNIKLAFAAVLIIAGIALLIAGYAMQAPKATTTTLTTSTTSSTESSTTSASSTSTTEPTSSSTTTSTTTTTFPKFIPLNVTDVEKCKQTILGKMNSFLAEVPEGAYDGRWETYPMAAFSITCDGSEDIRPDRVVFRGGNTVERNNPVAGTYRLMVKCGRNALINDLKDCSDLRASLSTRALQNKTSPPPL